MGSAPLRDALPDQGVSHRHALRRRKSPSPIDRSFVPSAQKLANGSETSRFSFRQLPSGTFRLG